MYSLHISFVGIGVIGMHVPDFVWDSDAKKRSLSKYEKR